MVGWTWSSYLYFFVFLGELQPSPPFRYPPCVVQTLLLQPHSFCSFSFSCPFLLLLRVTYKQFACFKNALDMALCSAFGFGFTFALALAFGFDSRRQLRLDLVRLGLDPKSSRRDCVLGAARCWGTYLSAYLKINVNSFIYFLCQIKRFKGYMQDIPSWCSILSLPASNLPSADYAPL